MKEINFNGENLVLQEANTRDVHNETRDDWQFITNGRAWSIARKSDKMPPYCGYLIELRDGRKLRCRRSGPKTIFEVSQ